jgi:hypothetical protein
MKSSGITLVTSFVAFFAQAESAFSAEFFVLPGTNSLLVLGETLPSDSSIIADYVQNDGIDTLMLRGPGGSLDAAFIVAELLLENSVNTVVPKDTDCASACAIIFSAGNKPK